MSTLIAKIDQSKYRTTLQTRGHEFIADEPPGLGTDLGPTPFDYLLGALGGCIAITLRMYADRKGWNLQEVEVYVDQGKLAAENCPECTTEKGNVHLMEFQLKLTGDLTADQRSRLKEIAGRCPVHKVLQNEIIIRSHLLEETANGLSG